MRIQHLITTLDVGGAELHLLAQVHGQAARGHEPHVAWLKGQGSLAGEFRAAGAASVERLDVGPLLPLRLAARVRRADLVHSHLLKADMAAALVATLAGRRRRLVSSKHSDERPLLRPVVSRVHGLLGNLPPRTIVLSDHVRGFVARHGRVAPARLRRIYYGIDPAPFDAALARPTAERRALRAALGLDADDVVFTCLARFAPAKAHPVLLAAFARALAERGEARPRLRLVLAGDDPFGDGRERAEARARELGLGATVVFAGVRRDVPELLAASDVLVMASLWEGLGLAFLEAMCARRPVLATTVSSIPEVVAHGETGLLVPPDDAPALARAMLALADDPDGRRRLGQAGRRRVEQRFGLERMLEETLAVYAELLDG